MSEDYIQVPLPGMPPVTLPDAQRRLDRLERILLIMAEREFEWTVNPAAVREALDLIGDIRAGR